MVFLSLLAALLLEQVRPLRHDNPIYLSFGRWAGGLERYFNAGGYHHGIIAWLLAILPPFLITYAVHDWLQELSLLLAWLWNVLILYLTMGFRQFSRWFTEIMQALRNGQPTVGRDCLQRWSGEATAEFEADEVARVAIELGLIESHKHVFGTIAWFLVLGPAGAMLYRTVAMLNEKWGARRDPALGEFGRFAADVFFWLDWVPARLTAASFAIVGNFEDAVYCWRTQAGAWAVHTHGILLASGAGAMGVRLGNSLHQHGGLQFRPEIGTGEIADVGYMQSAVGLIWRALVLWMFVILLAAIVHALG